MAISGIGTYFAIDNASGVLTNVSTYLDSVQPSSDPDDLDGTTFQPGVAAPARVKVPGFRTRSISLTGKWTPAADTFFSAIEGLQDLNYEYGPEGEGSGDYRISGVCSCLSFTGPQSSVDGVTTFAVELNADTRTTSTFVS